MMNIDMKLPMLVTPTPLLSLFMSLATMEGLISKFMFRTSLSNVFIGLNRYYRLVFRFRSMAAFPTLGSLSLVSLGTRAREAVDVVDVVDVVDANGCV